MYLRKKRVRSVAWKIMKKKTNLRKGLSEVKTFVSM